MSRTNFQRKDLTPTKLALAVAAGMMLASTAGWGAVVVTGPFSLDPYSAAPLGPGNVNLPGSRLFLGAGGGFSAMAGSVVTLAGLHADGTGLLSGAGTVLTLQGSDGRFDVGHQGQGTFSVAAGATLDGRANAAACLLGPYGCFAFIGNAVGSTGHFTVTDAGSSASFLGGFHVGGAGGLNQGWGKPGGTTRGTVDVLNGGLLRTEFATLAAIEPSPYSLGTEQSFANVTISGAGSAWQVTGSGQNDGGASFVMARGARTQAATFIGDGGLLALDTTAGRHYDLVVGNGGDAQLTVSGADSRLTINGDADRGILHVADGGGTGVLTVQDGGTLTSTARWTTLGHNGGNARLTVTGANSTASFGSAGVLNVGGDGSVGRLAVLNGGAVSTPQLNVGRYIGSTGMVSIDGVGSRVALSQVAGERFYVGDGTVTVSNGGVLDARVNASACDGGVWCGSLIGGHAGSTASLIVTGSGSKASFLGSFQAGRAELAVPALDGYSLGTPGAITVASVQVLDGGLILADRFAAGLGTYSQGATGDEGSLTTLRISGAGSTMQLTGGDNAAIFQTILWNANNAVVNVNINDGGQLLLQSMNGRGSHLSLSGRAGYTNFRASGAGTAVAFSGDEGGVLSVASNGGTALMSFMDGAQLSGVSSLLVGRGTSQGIAQGSLTFDGAATAGRLTGYVTGLVGSGGQGQLTLSNGATLATDAAASAAVLYIGYGNASARGSGKLNISGAGSTLRLQVADNADPYGSNPTMRVGSNGDGMVNISGGGSLLLLGGLPATINDFRTTSLSIGSGGVASANGTVDVLGSASRLAVRGVNAYIAVGAGALGNGLLAVRDGALVQTTLLGIADNGATGALRVDNATVQLNGEWQGTPTPLGASLSVGAGLGGVGVLTLDHNARLQIDNAGQASTALQLGGHSDNPLGTGVLTVANGSRIDVTSASGQGQVFIGRSGTGVATFSSGSAMNADYIGVGAVLGVDGGVGTLIVNDSTLTAATIEIGARGYVGGNGTLVGNVINRGVFNPGNSPGTLLIDGSFINAAGGRLVLEVEADGHGGFNTDHLVFAAGSEVDLGKLAISFRFLGGTDPNAFQASGQFAIDNFLQVQGSTDGLDSSEFAGVSFSASADAYTVTNFSFSADTGAAFTAAAVPEPGEWLMLMSGLGVLGLVVRRRKRKA